MLRLVVLVAACVLSVRAASAATLDSVRDNGNVARGVNVGLGGFSVPDSTGIWKGLDVDTCRAVAAAIFGDANKVRYVPTTGTSRFAALQSGEIDILSRNTTFTFVRDATIGLHMGLDNARAYNIVKQVGNYSESYERSVGKNSGLKLDRGPNALWSVGGLMHPIPFR